MALDPGYIPDPGDVTKPIEQVSGGLAAREIQAIKQRIIDNTHNIPLDTTNVLNAYSQAALPDNLATGEIYQVRINATNTGPTTLAPGAGAPVSVKKSDGVTELAADDLVANDVVFLYKTVTDLLLLTPNLAAIIATAQATAEIGIADAATAHAAADASQVTADTGITDAATAQAAAATAQTAADGAQTDADTAQASADTALLNKVSFTVSGTTMTIINT